MGLLIGLLVAVFVIQGVIVSRSFRTAVLIVAGFCGMLVWMTLGDPFGAKQAEWERVQRQQAGYDQLHAREEEALAQKALADGSERAVCVTHPDCAKLLEKLLPVRSCERPGAACLKPTQYEDELAKKYPWITGPAPTEQLAGHARPDGYDWRK